MIRTLLIISAVSFVFAVGCLSGAIAVAGGFFHIGPGFNFERTVKVCRTVYAGDHQMRNCRWASGDDGDDDANPAASNAAATGATAPAMNGQAGAANESSGAGTP